MATQLPTAVPSRASRKPRAFPVDRKIALFFGVLLVLAALNTVLVRNMLWHQQDISDTRSLVNKVGSLGQQIALQASGMVLGGEDHQRHVRDHLREMDAVLTALRDGAHTDGVLVRSLPTTLQPLLQDVHTWRDALVTRLAPVLQTPRDANIQTPNVLLQWHDDLLYDVTGLWEACRVLVHALVRERVQAQRNMLGQMYSLLLFDALALLGVYVWMRRTLVRPLRALASGWRKLAAGDYQVRLAHTPVAELNEVTQAFNESVERISSLLKQTEENLWRQANYDELTGLPNRYMFHHHLANEIGRAQRKSAPMALLFLDLNLFKEVNDTYGHKSGDRVLQQVAKRLTDCVREVDMVARLGGDEFVIVLSELGDSAVVTRICADIHAAFAAPFELEATTAYLSCSIGGAFYPDHGESPEALLHNADMAMYQAKRTQRDGCVFYGDVTNPVT